MSGIAINRRYALAGLVSLTGATAGPSLAGAHVPADRGTLDRYGQDASPADRLRHHLLMASLAADELVPEGKGYWSLHMSGEAGKWQPSFSLSRFYRVMVDDDPIITGTFETEKMEPIVSFGRLA